MKSVKYLEQVRTKFGLKTDAALALKLGKTASAVSQYLKGTRVMDEETCLAVALALDVNPLEVMMAAGIDRAEKSGQKSLWEVFMSRTVATAATLALATSAVTLFLTPQNAEARTYGPASSQTSGALCIMSNGRSATRRLRRTIWAWFKRLSVPHALQPATS